MKKIFAVLLVILSLAVSSYAVVTYSSNTISGSKVVVSGVGAMTGLLIMTDGTNAVTATVYDSLDTSGKILVGPMVVSGSAYFGGATWEIPVRYSTGLYITLSGSGGKAIVYYTHEL